MKWVDIYDIAASLEEKHPNEDIINLRFDHLQSLILALDDFDDAPNKCNEKVLEAIQQAWINER